MNEEEHIFNESVFDDNDNDLFNTKVLDKDEGNIFNNIGKSLDDDVSIFDTKSTNDESTQLKSAFPWEND